MTLSTTVRQYKASIADEARNGSDNVLVPLDADSDGWDVDVQLSQKRPGGKGKHKTEADFIYVIIRGVIL